MMHRGLRHCTGGSDQDHPQEKEMQKGKMLVWGGFTKLLRREEKWKAKEKKRKIYSFKCRVPKKNKNKKNKCRVPKNSKER